MKAYNIGDYVNTSDLVYSKSFFLGNNHIIIPYINLGLMPRNPINLVQSVIDFSFYVLSEINSIHYEYSELTTTIDFIPTGKLGEYEDEYVLTGGYDGTRSAEIKVECRARHLFVPESSSFKTSPLDFFIPEAGSRFKQNIDKDIALSFFEFENLPDKLKDMLGNSVQSFSWISR